MLYKVISLISFALKVENAGTFIDRAMQEKYYNAMRFLEDSIAIGKKLLSATIMYVLAVILIIVVIILLIIKIVQYFTNPNKRVSNVKNTISNENIINNNSNTIVNNTEINENNSNNINLNPAKPIISKEDMDKALNGITSFLKKYRKIIIGSCVSVVLIFGGIFGYKKISYMNKPDAIVTTSHMNIEINITGFEGYGKAEFDVKGVPEAYEFKDPKKYREINRELANYEVKLDKTENLKNGDEVTATLKFNKGKYKFKFDKDEITTKVTVSGLQQIVKEYSDISNSMDRIERKINEDITRRLGDAKNIKITKLKVFQKDIKENELKSLIASGEINSRSNAYSLIILYKLTYDEKQTTILFEKAEYKTVEKLFVENVDNFIKKDDALLFDVYTNYTDKFSESNLEDYVNRLKLQNYSEVR